MPNRNDASAGSSEQTRMLVVSDAATAEKMAAILEQLGEVITATSEDQARRLMSATGLEVVIVDTSADGIDGRALLDHARKVPGSVGRIVVGKPDHLRAYLDGADRSGADAVLLKPWESQRLLDTAEQVALRVVARRSQRVASDLVRALVAEIEQEDG